MKENLIKSCRGIEVLHSFVDGGFVFDCIPLEQQPSVRDSGKKLARIPDGQGIDITGTTKNTRGIRGEPALGPNRKDRFGKTMFCPSGTGPFRRITLDELARFETLRQSFRKSPSDSPDLHRWARYAQNVDNLGGYSILSVQYPFLDTSAGQTMSIGQQWYVSGDQEQQTAEVGWMVQPAKYHDMYTHLFLYWTADNYQTTGCWPGDWGRPGLGAWLF